MVETLVPFQDSELGVEEEYENVMDGVMQKMNHLVAEQEEMQAQSCILRDQLKNRDATIMTMRAEETRSDERLRNALKQQEMELQMLFEEKESQLKNLFADKVILIAVLSYPTEIKYVLSALKLLYVPISEGSFHLTVNQACNWYVIGSICPSVG